MKEYLNVIFIVTVMALLALIGSWFIFYNTLPWELLLVFAGEFIIIFAAFIGMVLIGEKIEGRIRDNKKLRQWDREVQERDRKIIRELLDEGYTYQDTKAMAKRRMVEKNQDEAIEALKTYLAELTAMLDNTKESMRKTREALMELGVKHEDE